MGRSHVVNLANFQSFTAVNFLSDPGAIGGPVVVPSCAQIRLGWVLESGKLAFQVLYGRYSGGFAGTQAQANAIMTALTTGTAWSSMSGALAPTTFFKSVDIRDVNTPNAALIVSNVAQVAGSGVGESLPNEVAIAVTLRTAQAGRGFRGRSYIPGWATSALAPGNVIGSAVVTAVNNWAATWFNAFSASGYTLVIGQKGRAAYIGSTGVSHAARPANSVAVTTATVRDNHWDSQRRRGLK